MVRIDAHIHYSGDHPDCVAAFERLDMKLLNVCVASTVRGRRWREQAEGFRMLAQTHPQTYAWCTAFDVPDFGDPHYMERVLVELEQDFAAGAVACKIWKNIGMETRKPAGEFLMVDDPFFDPLYEYLTSVDKPLLMHTGEPLACWQPLDEDNSHRSYYAAHPEWYMYDKPDYPSHQEIIAARDRMLARHPKLKVVGAHLGSLEYDVAEIAKRLDRYPNFAVDTSARLHNLASQEREAVRQFCTVYQDRILFGTDIVQRQAQSVVSESERQKNLSSVQKRYQIEYSYYETGETVLVHGREVQGLALPPAVLEKFYRLNAQRWYPGV